MRKNLVQALLGAGKVARADEVAKQSLVLLRATWGEGSWFQPWLMGVRASVLKTMVRNEEAIAMLEAVIRTHRRAQREESKSELPRALGKLAGALHDVGRFKEARPLFEEALALSRDLFPQGHPKIVFLLRALALCRSALGEQDEAGKVIMNALSEAERIFGKTHPEIARVLLDFAVILRKTGRYRAAVTHLRRALAIDEKFLGPARHDPDQAWPAQ